MKQANLVNQDGHQIRGNPGKSAYFQGGHEDYGRYMWNIKYYGWESDSEIEATQQWAFGDHVKAGSGYGFECISELLCRPIESYLAGRSDGWLVIETELTDGELKRVDAFVKSLMAGLPAFLKDERQRHKDEADAALKDKTERTERLSKDKRVRQAVRLIQSVAGPDATLMIQGIRIL